MYHSLNLYSDKMLMMDFINFKNKIWTVFKTEYTVITIASQLSPTLLDILPPYLFLREESGRGYVRNLV